MIAALALAAAFTVADCERVWNAVERLQHVKQVQAVRGQQGKPAKRVERSDGVCAREGR